MSEQTFQKKVIKWFKDRNVYVLNQHGHGWGAKGAPDLIVCYKGLFLAFELKVGKNEMQPDQIIHKKRIEKSGGLHFKPKTFDEFLKIMEEI